MRSSNFALPIPMARRLAGWPAECIGGLAFWLAFLLVLEPDNVLRAQEAGAALSAGPEMLRITVAALLGAGVTPVLCSLGRRFPLEGNSAVRHAFARLAGIGSLAAGLIVVSCFLAAWVFGHRWRPTSAELHAQLVSNGLLLVFALAVLDAIRHLVAAARAANVSRATGGAAAAPARIPVGARRRQSWVDPGEVDWIEAQGNYVALHLGGSVRLVRSTLAAFEATLDPALFLRIHRGTIVPLTHVRELRALSNGDAMAVMVNGDELRVSRRHRALLAQRCAGLPTSTLQTPLAR